MKDTSEYAGKTLILKYSVTNEWHQLIGGDYNAVATAIEIALRSSGLAYNGQVIPESISFEVK